jgi:N-methylhydantoinase A
MTTLVDAAVKVRVGAYVSRLRRELDAYTGTAVPFHIMKSNGGVLSADEVVHQPITTVLSGPAAGALGAALVTQAAGYDRCSHWTGRHVDRRQRVSHGEPALTTEGTVGAFPCKIPMIDIVTVGAGGGSIAWLSPEGTLKVGPRSAGADPARSATAGRRELTVTDAHVVLGRIPPHLLGGELPLDAARPAGLTDLGRSSASTDGLPPGSSRSRLEPGQRARQITVKRGSTSGLRADHVRGSGRCCCAG